MIDVVPVGPLLKMPAFETGRPSIERFVTVTVVPAGIESVPLPPSVPFDQVIVELVTLIGAVPPSEPKLMESVGTVTAVALFSVRTPDVRLMEPTLVMLLSVVVPPLHPVVALML